MKRTAAEEWIITVKTARRPDCLDSSAELAAIFFFFFLLSFYISRLYSRKRGRAKGTNSYIYILYIYIYIVTREPHLLDFKVALRRIPMPPLFLIFFSFFFFPSLRS